MTVDGERYHCEQNEGYLTLRILREKLDLFETPDILKSVERVLRNGGYPNCLFDLEQVKVLDSTGIGFFIAVNNMLKKKGSRMALTGITERVVEIFRITRMNTYLKCFKTESDAREFLGGP
ncbi:MAG: STAS domain-containing protein [Spirochaetes bacterium]|nr:STAS domain-containing protein [Spirochaetota bacterium]